MVVVVVRGLHSSVVALTSDINCNRQKTVTLNVGQKKAQEREEEDDEGGSGAKGGAVGLKVAAPRVCTLGNQVYGNVNGTDECEITRDVV